MKFFVECTVEANDQPLVTLVDDEPNSSGNFKTAPIEDLGEFQHTHVCYTINLESIFNIFEFLKFKVYEKFPINKLSEIDKINLFYI